MLWELASFIVDKVEQFWYIWIFLMMTLESSFIPFPSELAMIPAWYLASSWSMNFYIALFAWSIWALIGACINYFIGFKLWWPVLKVLIKKYWKYVFVSENHYDLWEKYFKKHWSITTFNARFIPAVRQLISLPAWVFKMSIPKFLIYTWIWASIWNLILMYIWYIAWQNRELISEYSSLALMIVIWFIVVLSILYIVTNKYILKAK